MISVSIIVPIYNGEKYIERCLNSIISQTLENIEIILVNDNSTDETKSIIEKYSKQYKNIVVINKKNNEGVGAARNNGMKIAKGEYIGFIDADDVINDDMYENLYKLAKYSNSDLAMCSYIRKYNNECVEVSPNISEKNVYYDRKKILNKIIPTFVNNIEYGYYYVWNKLYKREFLEGENIVFEEEITYSEDWLFNLEVFDKAQSFSYINNPYYTYFDNANSLSKNIDINRIKLSIEGYKKNYYFINKYNLENVNVDIRFLEEVYVYLYSLVVSNNSYELKKKIISFLSKNEQFLGCLHCIDKFPRFIKYILFLLKYDKSYLLIKSIEVHNKLKER